MVHNEILDKEKKIFFTFSYGEMSRMADASRTIENNKKNIRISIISPKMQIVYILTVYVFIITFNVNDNKGNEKKNLIVTFIAVCRYLLRKSRVCVCFFKYFFALSTVFLIFHIYDFISFAAFFNDKTIHIFFFQ